MKVECSCGVKYEFELTEDMRARPIRFVCPSCGVDASEFVDALVRRELGQQTKPAGEPISMPLEQTASGLRTTKGVQLSAPTPSTEVTNSLPFCTKHPGEVAREKCYICSKPICPKCMELFGYVCSPLCKAKAASRGITLPVYKGQKSIVEARRWRKVVWTSSLAGGLLVAFVAVWFWYSWFGCMPKPIFSVRFAEPAYSGQSAFAGKLSDQIVFLHGGTLARYDLKSGKEIWSRKILERDLIQDAVDKQSKANKALLDRANSEAWEQMPKLPSAEQLAETIERQAAAALTLHARGENIWVASPAKLVRYNWQTGQSVKEVPVRARQGEPIYRETEVMQVGSDAGKIVVTHIDLASGETRSEELMDADSKLFSATELAGGSDNIHTKVQSPRPEKMAGLPSASPGSDANKPMDPARVAAQAQKMSLPEKIALPATLAANMNQQRALNELNSSRSPSVAPLTAQEPGFSFSLVPARDGFVEFSVKLLERRLVARSAMKAGSGRSALNGDVTAGRSMELASDMLNEMQRSNGGDVVQEDQSRYQVTLRRNGTAEVWTGEVVGPPKVYPLESVTVLAGDKTLIVLNETDQKLWQSTLAFKVPAEMNALDEESARYGCGPCVEHHGFLYVFDEGVLSAFDVKTGNARWRLPTVGIAGLFFDEHGMLYVNTTTASHESLKYSRQIDLSRKVVSVILKVDSRNGKILWSQQSSGLANYVSGNLILTSASFMPEEQEGVDTGFEKSPWLRIRRINPSNGREVWEHFQERAPLDIAFEKNTIRLVFKKEVQVLKYPTF
jgi:outer membrane protein assembly factor BamB